MQKMRTKRGPFITVRADLLAVCGDLAEALVVEVLRGYHEPHGGEPKPGEHWIKLTYPELCKKCLNVRGDSKVSAAIRSLSAKGLLHLKPKDPGGRSAFMLNIPAINELLDALPERITVADNPSAPGRHASWEAGIAASRANVHLDPLAYSYAEGGDDPSVILRQGLAYSYAETPAYFYASNKKTSVGISLEDLEQEDKNGDSFRPAPREEEATDCTYSSESRENSSITHTRQKSVGRHTKACREEEYPISDGLSVGDQREPEQNPQFHHTREKESSTVHEQYVQAEESSNTDSGTFTSAYRGDVNSKQPTTPPHSPSPTSRPVPLPQQTSGVMGEAQGAEAAEPMDFRWFCRSYRRRCPKTKNITGYDRKRVEAFLDEHEGTDGMYIDRCLEGYGKSDWGQANKFPIAGFLKNWESWAEYAASEPAEAQDETEAEKRPTGPSAASIAPGASKWDAAAAWNAKVQHAPKVALDIRQTKRYSAVTSDMEFQRQFDTIVEKVESLHEVCGDEVKNWLKFGWVIDTKPGELEPNWKKIAAGNMDFILKRKQPEKSVFLQSADGVAERLMARYGLTA